MKSKENELEKQFAELAALQPISVTFKGKPRSVHFFHQGTAEKFNRVLEIASESDTMKQRHNQQVKMLAIVLSDLYGKNPLFIGLRRWFWEQRLKHSDYNEVEALQLIDAAVTRIQQGKFLELYSLIVAAQMQATIKQMHETKNSLKLNNTEKEVRYE